MGEHDGPCTCLGTHVPYPRGDLGRTGRNALLGGGQAIVEKVNGGLVTVCLGDTATVADLKDAIEREICIPPPW